MFRFKSVFMKVEVILNTPRELDKQVISFSHTCLPIYFTKWRQFICALAVCIICKTFSCRTCGDLVIKHNRSRHFLFTYSQITTKLRYINS